MAEVPHLVEVQDEYAERGLAVLGVTGVSPARAEEFAGAHGATYPILAGASETFQAWGVSILPETYLIGPDGAVVARGLESIRAVLAETFDS